MDTLVTLGGECFEAEFKRKMPMQDRIGFCRVFSLRDLKENRPGFQVSVFWPDRDGATDPEFDSKVEETTLNVIRRAFDDGTLSFDMPHDPQHYQDLVPNAETERPAASRDNVRRFIREKAFWVGFRVNPKVGKYLVQFDSQIDLDYLQVGRERILQEVWLLREQGYLAKDENWPAGAGRPTAKLIDEYEVERRGQQRESFPRDLGPEGTGSSVFVVHGHDEGMRQSVARFLEKLHLQPIILHEQPSLGRTLIEKFERHSNVRYAVVLLSPDDLGACASTPNELKPRARQNVVLELGYFIGKLGRSNVCALLKDDVERPSDLVGLVYVPYEGDQGNWRIGLAREIKAAGIRVDMNLV